MPGRTNIVISRNPVWHAEGVETVHFRRGRTQSGPYWGSERLYVIGGAEIYRLFLTRAERLELTLVDEEAAMRMYFFLTTPVSVSCRFDNSRVCGGSGARIRKPGTQANKDVMDYN